MSFRISAGAPPKCLCAVPRQGAIGSCRSCRKRAPRSPSMCCMRDQGSTVSECFCPMCRRSVRSDPAAPFRGLCALDWSEAGLRFPASPAPTWYATASRHSSSGSDAPSTRSRTCLAKDRLVPVHTTTLAALCQYARHRDAAFPASKDTAFFLSSRGNRLSAAGLYAAFDAACALAGLDSDKGLRPHDLRHNSGTRIIPATDVQRMYFLENRGVVGTRLAE